VSLLTGRTVPRAAYDFLQIPFGRVDTLVAWYKDPHPEDEQTARGASLRVGRFIEQTCALNLGGIR
jgi:hypothetical protein